MRILKSVIFSVIIILFSPSAWAKDLVDNDWKWPNGTIEKNGEWQVYKGVVLGGCLAETQTKEGDTFVYGLNGPDANRMLILSYNLGDTVKENTKYDLNLDFGKCGSWNTGFFPTMLEKPVLFGNYSDDSEFRGCMMSSSSLKVKLRKKTIAKISLKGSGKALKELRACHNDLYGSGSGRGPTIVDREKLLEAAEISNAAGEALKQKNYDKALDLFKKSMDIRQNELGVISYNLSTDLHNIGVVLKRKGDYKQTASYYTQAIDMLTQVFGAESKELAVAKANLADLRYDMGQRSAAIALYEDAIALYEKVNPNQFDVKFTPNYYNIAKALFESGHIDRSDKIVTKTLQNLEEFPSENTDLVLSSFLLKAAIAEERESFELSNKFLERAKIIAEKFPGKNEKNTLEILTAQANTYITRSNYFEAEKIWEKILDIQHKYYDPNDLEIADSYKYLGATRISMFNHESGKKDLNKALQIGKESFGENDLWVADIEALLSDYHAAVGNFQEAVRLGEAAYQKRIQVEEIDNELLANSQSGLAFIYSTLGQNDKAENYFRNALSLLIEKYGTEHSETAKAMIQLASELSLRGESNQVEKLLLQGIEIIEEKYGPTSSKLFDPLNKLTSWYMDKEKFEIALDLFPRMKRLNYSDKDLANFHLGSIHNSVGLIYTSQGKQAEALEEFKLAQEYFKQLDADFIDIDLAIALHNQARTLRKLGQIEEAVTIQQRSVKLIEKYQVQKPDYYAIMLSELGHLYLLQNRSDEALEILRQASKQSQKHKLEYLRALYQEAEKKPEQASALMEESLEYIQSINNSGASEALQKFITRLESQSGELADLIRQEQDGAIQLKALNNQLLKVVASSKATNPVQALQALRSKISQSEQSLLDLRNNIATAYPNYNQLAESPTQTLDQIRASLQDDEVLLVVDNGTDEHPNNDPYDDYIWAITKSGIEWKKLHTKTSEISNHVDTLRAGLDLGAENKTEFDLKTAHDLYTKIFKPVESTLNQVEKIVLVLNGSIASLPPQVLLTDIPPDRINTVEDYRSLSWLGKSHAIQIFPSVASLVSLRQKGSASKATKTMRGYGDPLFNPEESSTQVKLAARGFDFYFTEEGTNLDALRQFLPRLPATADELKTVGAELSVPAADIVLQGAATEEAVKTDNLLDYKIIYFATHGLITGEVALVNKSTAEPALALSVPSQASELDDGLLTASEIATLNLDAEWVVLSACNTAAQGRIGNNTLSGLARSFFYAGARSMIVSHWVVDDAATAALMKQTFSDPRANLPGQQSKALQNAMLSIMTDPDNPQWAHPSYWAPFILVGQPKYFQ